MTAWLTTLGYLLAVASVVVGVALVNIPAAFIVAGVLVGAGCVVIDLDKPGDGQRGENSTRPSG